MVRIAHFSDLHYGPKNLIEADRCFGFAVDEAIRRGDYSPEYDLPSPEELQAKLKKFREQI